MEAQKLFANSRVNITAGGKSNSVQLSGVQNIVTNI